MARMYGIMHAVLVFVQILVLCYADAPTQAPVDLTIASTDITSFKLTWTQPDDFTSGDKYQIDISEDGSLTYIPTQCGTIHPTYNDSVTDTAYTFQLGKPYNTYTVTVSVSRSNVLGPGSKVTPTTIEKASDPFDQTPTFVDQTTNNGTVVALKGDLNWHYPCQPNGVIQNFQISMNGTYTEDASDISKTVITADVKKEYNQTYDLTKDLEYSRNYELRIATKNRAGVGDASTITFKTKAGYPPLPANLQVTDDGHTLNIVWDESTVKVGKIQYIVDIVEKGPGEGDIDCNQPQPEPISNTTDGNTFSTSIQGYYLYDITVTGQTEAGKGPSVNVQQTTQPFYPEEIQQFQYAISNNTESDQYQSSFSATFEKPCRFNGHFSHYAIECDGQRADFPEDVHAFNITDGELKFNFDLLPEYEYSCSVCAVSEEFKGKTTDLVFKAKSGVPVRNESAAIKVPTAKSYNSFVFNLLKNYFTEEHGSNLYWAIMVSKNESVGETYGYWDGVNWPKSQFYVTKEKWQPFEDDQAEVDVDIENLDEELNYYLSIRAFTSDAFKDVTNIPFRTTKKPADDGPNWGMIGGIIGGVAALICVLVVAFVLWRRRKNRNTTNM